MDCTLVYALVPNETLDATVQGEARRLAEETLRRVGTTMALEAQGLDEEDMRVQLDAEMQRIIDASRLWRST